MGEHRQRAVMEFMRRYAAIVRDPEWTLRDHVGYAIRSAWHWIKEPFVRAWCWLRPLRQTATITLDDGASWNVSQHDAIWFKVGMRYGVWSEGSMTNKVTKITRRRWRWSRP